MTSNTAQQRALWGGDTLRGLEMKAHCCGQDGKASDGNGYRPDDFVLRLLFTRVFVLFLPSGAVPLGHLGSVSSDRCFA